MGNSINSFYVKIKDSTEKLESTSTISLTFYKNMQFQVDFSKSIIESETTKVLKITIQGKYKQKEKIQSKYMLYPNHVNYMYSRTRVNMDAFPMFFMQEAIQTNLKIYHDSICSLIFYIIPVKELVLYIMEFAFGEGMVYTVDGHYRRIADQEKISNRFQVLKDFKIIVDGNEDAIEKWNECKITLPILFAESNQNYNFFIESVLNVNATKDTSWF